MTIASDYLETTGETVGRACQWMHQSGWGIERAAREIGYASTTELRKYLARRNLPCPWPSRIGGGRPPIQIKDATLERYAELVVGGLTRTAAARAVGCRQDSIAGALGRRRPDLADKVRRC